jgi:hypothetical protein
MNAGILERILTRRYGQPVHCIRNGMAARSWNSDDPQSEALLYVGMKWNGPLSARFSSLRAIYGDSAGGFLDGDSLRAALLWPRSVHALWYIDDLRAQPEVRQALLKDPGIDYFMDSNNVYFYGVKAGNLYVFDALNDELDPLGPIEQALETIMDELESVKDEVRDEDWMP